MKRLIGQIRLLCRVVRHPKTPWYAKVIGGCSVAYLLSPVQLIPTFIPLIGQLDDLLVLYAGMKVVTRLVPQFVLDECSRTEPVTAKLSLRSSVLGVDSCADDHLLPPYKPEPYAPNIDARSRQSGTEELVGQGSASLQQC